MIFGSHLGTTVLVALKNYGERKVYLVHDIIQKDKI